MSARIRTIKPEFWTSEQIVECSTNARLLFVGLLNFCDDAGRHPASLRRLKMEVFPGDPFDLKAVGKMVSELVSVGLVLEYESQGQSYWQVTGWDKHQKVDRPNVKFPGPFDDDSTNARRTLDEHSPPESKGRESNGVEGIHTCASDADEKPKMSADERAFHERFWPAYPRKIGKGAALTAFIKARQSLSKLGPPDDARNHIIGRAETFAKSAKGQGDYCPYPATWLNQGRYDDDPAEWDRTGGNGTTDQPLDLSFTPRPRNDD